MQHEPENTRLSDRWINLAAERLGTRVLYANDEFFAAKENLIKPGRAIFIPGKYVDTGKWMDGWETRRRREPGHDFAWIRLGLSGRIRGFDIDTHHFNGNQPTKASVDAACLPHDPDENTTWTCILEPQPLGPSSQHLFEIDNTDRFTHVRLNIYPDGGVARFRVFGEVRADWDTIPQDAVIDLASVTHEGKVILCSDMHFGHKDNMNAPGRGSDMGDGWETRRRRGPGHDWAIIALGKRGELDHLVVDTAHFKGNYPDRCSVDGANLSPGVHKALDRPDIWSPVLGESKLRADHEHIFSELLHRGPFTHLRLNIFPDGGISRFRVMGRRCD